MRRKQPTHYTNMYHAGREQKKKQGNWLFENVAAAATAAVCSAYMAAAAVAEVYARQSF